jgi:hypothetical protein
LGKAAALPYQNFGLIGKSARFDLHEPAVAFRPANQLLSDARRMARLDTPTFSKKVHCANEPQFSGRFIGSLALPKYGQSLPMRR